MTDGQFETPEPDRAKHRIAPRVVLASAGVVVATLFATVAALTSGSDDAAPAARNPLEDVVSKNTLRSAPSQTTTQAKPEVDAISSAEAPPTTTTTPRKTKVTTVTQPDGTTTTTTVDDTTPPAVTTPPVGTSASSVPASSVPAETPSVPVSTTTPTPSSVSVSASSGSANDGVGDQ